jgi:hypothetical protein
MKPALRYGIIQLVTELGADAPHRTKEIFISYVGADKGAARTMANRLVYSGFKVWYDESEIAPGDRWGSAIFHALRNADAVLLLLSEKAQESIAMQFELGAAIADVEDSPTKRIIPVLLPGSTPPSGLLAPYQYVDARDGDLSRVVDQVAEALRSSPPTDKKHDRAIELQVLRNQHAVFRDMASKEAEMYALRISLLGLVLAAISGLTSGFLLSGIIADINFSRAFWYAVTIPLVVLPVVGAGYLISKRRR